MKKYRTIEQFETILESRYNGNVEQSAKQMIEYGFFAIDLKYMFKDYEEQFKWFDPLDLFVSIELATEIREGGE